MLVVGFRKQAVNDCPPPADCLVVGKESVGKSQLISSLTQTSAGETNYRGSTVQVDRYGGRVCNFVDTPGILRKSDTQTTFMALAALQESDTVLLVVQGTRLDDDLRDMLPLVLGKRGAIVVTYWDKVPPGPEATEAIQRVSEDVGVDLVAVDARKLSEEAKARIEAAMMSPRPFTKASLTRFAGWCLQPKPGALENRVLGPVFATLLLLFPVLATIYGSNGVAHYLHPIVSSCVDVAIEYVNQQFHPWLQIVLTAKHGEFGYGLLNMGPFLMVWALPTVIVFSVILGLYKSSGLIDRLNWILDPWLRPLGLSGRDAVRVMMGFGCNVPAVISTRACSGCSRGPAMSAIAFGAACSYQLPATLAVLASATIATGYSATWLTFLFLSYLLFTTVLYLRWTAPRKSRSALNVLMTSNRSFIQLPNLAAVWRDLSSTLRQFVFQALPIFMVICIIASMLQKLGAMDALSRVVGPVMGAFNLPSETALAIVLSFIRKDGIFLLAADGGLRLTLTASQVLTVVYLSGVLLPCLVTALTIARESSYKAASFLLVRQAAFAILFSLILAWVGKWIL